MDFHWWMLHGQVISALMLCFWEPNQRYRLPSSLGETPTAVGKPRLVDCESSARPFHIPALSTGLEVLFSILG